MTLLTVRLIMVNHGPYQWSGSSDQWSRTQDVEMVREHQHCTQTFPRNDFCQCIAMIHQYFIKTTCNHFRSAWKCRPKIHKYGSVCTMKSYLLMKIAGDDYPLQGRLNGTSAWGEWRLKTVLLPRCICQVFRHKLWHIHKGHFSDEVALHCICKHEHKGFDVSTIDGSSLHQENFLIRSNTANV